MAEIEHGTLVSWRLSRGKGIGIALTEPVRGKVVVAGFFGRKKGTCRHQTVPRAAVSRRGPGPKDEQLFAYAAKWDDIQAAEASARAARAARKAARVQSQLLEGARKLDAFGFDVEELDKFNRARRAHGVRWDQYIDDLVVMTKPDELLQSVEQYLNATGLELTALIGEDGVVLRRNRGRVAVICATRAKFSHGPEVSGNFLRDGAHWEAVRQRVIAGFSTIRTSDASSSPADKSTKLLIEMPATVSHEVRKAAIEASTRLRTERTLAFGHPVVLSAPGYRLRFEPITAHVEVAGNQWVWRRRGGGARCPGEGRGNALATWSRTAHGTTQACRISRVFGGHAG